MILTEDKDFGEWVFSHKVFSIGIVFLRYEYKDLKDIIKALLYVLEEKSLVLYNKFTVITPKKVRIREIS